MTGIIVFLAVACYDVLDLFDGTDRMSKSEELTPLFSVISLADACYCLVFVCHGADETYETYESYGAYETNGAYANL